MIETTPTSSFHGPSCSSYVAFRLCGLSHRLHLVGYTQLVPCPICILAKGFEGDVILTSIVRSSRHTVVTYSPNWCISSAGSFPRCPRWRRSELHQGVALSNRDSVYRCSPPLALIRQLREHSSARPLLHRAIFQTLAGGRLLSGASVGQAGTSSVTTFTSWRNRDYCRPKQATKDLSEALPRR